MLMDELAKREITSILIEGGASVAAAAVEEKLVDKVHFFLAPMIVGGCAAPGPVGGRGIARLQEAVRLDGVVMERLGHDLHIEAYVSKGE